MEKKLPYPADEPAFSWKKLSYSVPVQARNSNSLVLVFLLFLLFGNVQQITAQHTYIKHYSTADGLPSNNCYFTLQDSKGYIWAATDAGVSRFDGKVFETFSIEDGLPDNQIIRLNEDSSGKIWFSALNGQLSYFYKGRIYNEQNNKLLKKLRFTGVVISFYEDRKGHLWFGTNKNLLVRWDGKTVKRFSSADPKSQFINTVVYEDKSGIVWAASSHCLRYFDGKTFHKSKQHLRAVSYKTAASNADHTMLFLDYRGLNFVDGDKQQLTLRIDRSLIADNAGYFYAENGNELWLANRSGVYHLESDGTKTHYLPQVTTSQVIKDNKENMWFTTNNGLYMLPKKSRRIYMLDSHQGLSQNTIKSLASDNSNRIWMGMENGIINLLDRPAFGLRHFTLQDHEKYSSIKELKLNSARDAMVFSAEFGIGKIPLKGSASEQMAGIVQNNNTNVGLKSFTIGPDHQIAMAMSSGVLVLQKPGTNFSFSSADYIQGKNFFAGRAYRVYYGKNNELWFSNLQGLSQIKDGKLIRHYLNHPLLTKRINDIAQLADGTIVLATDGYGMLFYQNGKLSRQLTRLNGLANNICKKLSVRDGYIWVITNNGINRIEEGGSHRIESFEYTNSLLSNDVNDMLIEKDTVWFATNRGLVYFANTPFDKTRETPKVLISSISSKNKELTPDSTGFVLKPGDNSISFYFSALDFQNSNILYRYRLKTSNPWTETKSRRLEISSLEPGNYQFELSAKTGNSAWSTPTVVTFTQEEHFWQSFWFMALLLLLASFSFYKIAVYVTRQQKNKEQQQLVLKNRILMLEQQALQAMMNPHFVFNVMNSIQHYINTKDTSSANKILTGFARLIRKNLDICTRSFISLEEELEYLGLYLSLEKKRFGDKFNYTLKIDPEIDQDDTRIPSMILQPYIENAIWHGLMPKENGGKIEIIMSRRDPVHLLIEIIDDGIGIDNSLQQKRGSHQSKGMVLTQERINLINQIEANPIQIEIRQNGISGTIVSVLLPN
ncbi:diguanylate cyclase [Pedobacter antarcticus 4BY]|uniref:Diguanylate cyclase n=1 Tax=Pedobacter antarcticus 4BY TaxID=1358423 RepID=A0A081PEW9_9SPHI|nr:two-component regulator propeller domain-containing protein [Pedobacter antarcticus]KEQ29242.1 diguanylate cyclase [Pedobacter antarcticus 4BY]